MKETHKRIPQQLWSLNGYIRAITYSLQNRMSKYYRAGPPADERLSKLEPS